MDDFVTESCSICEQRHSTINAELWCLQCNEFLCPACKEHHSMSRFTQAHKTIPVQKYHELSPLTKNIKQNCTEHGEIYGFLCTVDDTLCCRKCITEVHKKCTDFLCLDDLLSSRVLFNGAHDTEHNLECQAQNLSSARKDRDGNRKLVKEQNEKYRSDLKTVRQKINECLDKLETKLLEELDYTTDLQIRDISKIVDEIDVLQCRVDEMKNDVNELKERPNDLLKYCGFRKLETDANNVEAEIKLLIESEKMDRINVEMSISSEVSSFLGKIKSLGAIRVVDRPRAVSLINKKRFAAQAVKVTPNPEEQSRTGIQLQLSTKVQAPNGKAGITLTGCAISPTGGIFLADFSPSKRILSINGDGIFSRDVTFPDSPVYDLTFIDATHIALTTGSYREIKILDISTQNTLRTIKTSGNVYGITFENGSLVYCVGKHNISRLIMSDQTTTEIQSGKMKNNSYICHANDNLFYTGENGESIVCRAVNGDVIWTFSSEKLKHPRGIAVHASGDIFVVGEGSNNLITISKDGRTFTELLTDVDGLKKPSAVCCDSKTNILAVCNKDGCLMVFKIIH